jgi:hypothetical protein
MLNRLPFLAIRLYLFAHAESKADPSAAQNRRDLRMTLM